MKEAFSASHGPLHCISTGIHTAETGVKNAQPKKKGVDQIKTISGYCRAQRKDGSNWLWARKMQRKRGISMNLGKINY